MSVSGSHSRIDTASNSRSVFAFLAEQPHLYPAVDHIRPGYRRSVCGVHSIYYRVAEDGIEIVRILKHQNLGDTL